MQVIGIAEAQRAMTQLKRIAFPDLTSKSLNRTADRIKTQSVRTLAERMGIKQSAVRSKIKVQKCGPSSIDQGAIIRIEGGSMNLMRFGARQTKKGVSAKPWGNRRIFKSAFIVRGKAVMRRVKDGSTPAKRKKSKGAVRDARTGQFLAGSNKGKGGFVGRLPIEPMRGPGLAKTASEDVVAQERVQIMRTFFPAELDRLIKLRLKGAIKVQSKHG
jgi:hypothetical protein